MAGSHEMRCTNRRLAFLTLAFCVVLRCTSATSAMRWAAYAMNTRRTTAVTWSVSITPRVSIHSRDITASVLQGTMAIYASGVSTQ